MADDLLEKHLRKRFKLEPRCLPAHASADEQVRVRGMTAALAHAYDAPAAPGFFCDLPDEAALAIWRERFIGEPGLYRVAALDGPIAVALLDAEIDAGVPEATGMLRVALNAGFGEGDLWLNPVGPIDALVIWTLAEALRRGGDAARPALAGVIRAQLALTMLPRLMSGGTPEETAAAWARARGFAGSASA